MARYEYFTNILFIPVPHHLGQEEFPGHDLSGQTPLCGMLISRLDSTVCGKHSSPYRTFVASNKNRQRVWQDRLLV